MQKLTFFGGSGFTNAENGGIINMLHNSILQNYGEAISFYMGYYTLFRVYYLNLVKPQIPLSVHGKAFLVLLRIV